MKKETTKKMEGAKKKTSDEKKRQLQKSKGLRKKTSDEKKRQPQKCKGLKKCEKRHHKNEKARMTPCFPAAYVKDIPGRLLIGSVLGSDVKQLLGCVPDDVVWCPEMWREPHITHAAPRHLWLSSLRTKATSLQVTVPILTQVLRPCSSGRPDGMARVLRPGPDTLAGLRPKPMSPRKLSLPQRDPE
jgi:hypothetical protein